MLHLSLSQTPEAATPPLDQVLGPLHTVPPASPAGFDPALIAAIAAYRRHPYQRTLTEPPVVWQEGESRVLDYAGPAAVGPRVLFVPSLINRAYILDLAPGRSMMRFLAAAGLRVGLLDWGWPGAAERRFTVDDYIAGRLARAVTALSGDRPLVLAGYCMGGLMSLAAAQLQPDRVRALALLATPWDFHAGHTNMAARVSEAMPRLEALLAGGTLPIDALQAMFALDEAPAVAAKYRAFAAWDPASEAAQMFVATEDWLADGVPLAAAVARDCLASWYGGNATARGEWSVAGTLIDPAVLRVPAFVAVPGRDRIVPPGSARPLAALLTDATLIEPETGHVAMVAGARAPSHLWHALLDWLRRS